RGLTGAGCHGLGRLGEWLLRQPYWLCWTHTTGVFPGPYRPRKARLRRNGRGHSWAKLGLPDHRDIRGGAWRQFLLQDGWGIGRWLPDPTTTERCLMLPHNFPLPLLPHQLCLHLLHLLAPLLITRLRPAHPLPAPPASAAPAAHQPSALPADALRSASPPANQTAEYWAVAHPLICADPGPWSPHS